MTYNGYVADLFLTLVPSPCGRRFVARARRATLSTWLTAVLAAAIGAVYMAATLLLTNTGQVRALMFPLCSLAMAFCSFAAGPGASCLRSRRSWPSLC